MSWRHVVHESGIHLVPAIFDHVSNDFLRYGVQAWFRTIQEHPSTAILGSHVWGDPDHHGSISYPAESRETIPIPHTHNIGAWREEYGQAHGDKAGQ